MLCEIDNFRYLTNINGLSLLDGTYLERLICSFYRSDKLLFERIVDLKDLKLFFETESITGVKDILCRLASQGALVKFVKIGRYHEHKYVISIDLKYKKYFIEA